jgi:uncharacterized protein YciI
MTVFAVEYVYDADSGRARDDHRPAHRAWLTALAGEGALLTSGPYSDGAGALLIFKASDDAALSDLLQQDPFASAQVISAIRITEWNPVIGLLAEHAA